MPRFSIFLVETSSGYLRAQQGITSAFLQPQPSATASANPASKTPDSNSVVLTASSTNPGQWFADIVKPYPRYDLYINGSKQTDFSGSVGFDLPVGNNTIFFKRDVEIAATAVETPEVFTIGSGKLATPDNGRTWPDQSYLPEPIVVLLEPSQLSGTFYRTRNAKILKGSFAQDQNGKYAFSVSLDPDGPELAHYYCDMMIIFQ